MINNKVSTGLSRKQKGQELIEFAIVLPFLFLVLFGVIDLGRIFFSAIVITNAAREGARYGISRGINADYSLKSAEIIAAARGEAAGSGIDLSSAAIVPSCPDGCASGKPVRVEISYDFNLLMGWVLPNTTITLDRYVQMMIP